MIRCRLNCLFVFGRLSLLWVMLCVGCGTVKVDPLELGRCFHQAEQAIEIARQQNVPELAESAFYQADQLLIQAKQALEDGQQGYGLELAVRAQSEADYAVAIARQIQGQEKIEQLNKQLSVAQIEENSLKVKAAQAYQSLAEERATQAEARAEAAERKANLAEGTADQAKQKSSAEIQRANIQLQLDRAKIYLEIAKAAGADAHAPTDYLQAESTIREGEELLNNYQLEAARDLSAHAEALAKDVQMVTMVAAAEEQTNSSQVLAMAELTIQQVEDEIRQSIKFNAETHAPDNIAEAKRLLDQAKLQITQESYQLSYQSAKQALVQSEKATAIAENSEKERQKAEAEAEQTAQAKDIIFKLEEQLNNKEIIERISQLANTDYQSVLTHYEKAKKAEKQENYPEVLTQGQRGLTRLKSAINAADSVEEKEKELEQQLRQQMPKKVQIERTEKGIMVRLDTDIFEPNSITLNPKHYSALKRLGYVIKSNASYKINIEAHSDSIGSDKANLAMSQKRADNFSLYLSQKCGAPKERLKAIGLGEEFPVASNINKNGRAKNRRVDTIFLTREMSE